MNLRLSDGLDRDYRNLRLGAGLTTATLAAGWGAGTTSTPPHAEHLTRLPASAIGALNRFWQAGQETAMGMLRFSAGDALLTTNARPIVEMASLSARWGEFK